MQNYFELFDLETSFFIDEIALKEAYRKEISRFHPDQYATKSESEKLQALQNTSLLNSAFKALKSSLNRAEYLLKLQGVDPFDEKDTVMDEHFLLSQIDLEKSLRLLRSLKIALVWMILLRISIFRLMKNLNQSIVLLRTIVTHCILKKMSES